MESLYNKKKLSIFFSKTRKSSAKFNEPKGGTEEDYLLKITSQKIEIKY